MLIELTVNNFAIIDTLRLSLGPRLNVFTGETGAGKSIIVDAVAALIGERLGSDVVRSGSDRAVIEGVFDVAPLLAVSGVGPQDALSEEETLTSVLAELGAESEDGSLILSREIARGGRSIARINGRAVPLTALQRVGAFLVDIHGQSAHLTLLRPDQHVYYLDRYAGTEDLRRRVTRLVAEWRAARRAYERLQGDEREAERRQELLRYQIDEIEAARLRPGELEELERERRLLANAERLGELCVAVHGALAGGDVLDAAGTASGALDLLATARQALSDLLRLDDALRDQLVSLEQALYLAEDVAAAVRSYQEEVAADPARQAEVGERLDLIAKLRRKYGATIEEILAFAAAAQAELDELSNREARVAELQAREETLRREIGVAAAELSERRQAASAQLNAAMERELNDLNMRKARFQTRIERREDPEGAPVEESGETRTYAFTATGIDHAEFLLAPNPGEPFKPLARIASGGEASRIMLALKTILCQADNVPVLIFDEIDTGVSGRTGQVVGEKLWGLGRTHQVLSVTHLPQIAALGDTHFQVSKAVADERTATQVQELPEQGRVIEIGQMLGDTPTARANAADLLRRGREWKQSGMTISATA